MGTANVNQEEVAAKVGTCVPVSRTQRHLTGRKKIKWTQGHGRIKFSSRQFCVQLSHAIDYKKLETVCYALYYCSMQYAISLSLQSPSRASLSDTNFERLVFLKGNMDLLR